MKNKIIQSALSLLILLSVSCSQDKVHRNKRTNATAITFVSPQGVETRLKLDDGDGKITSGFSGMNRHQEVRELSLEESEACFIIHTNGKIYYVPHTYSLEVSTN